MTSRRDAFTFFALDADGGTNKVYIGERRLLGLAKLGSWVLLEARDLVPQVLGTPTVIFEGVRWEKDEDKDRAGWRCYCAKPAFMYDQRGDKVTSDPRRVFLVFVNEEGMVYNWRWDWADDEDPDVPKGEDRFIKKVYDSREVT